MTLRSLAATAVTIAALAAAGQACAQGQASAPTRASVTVLDPAQVRQESDLALGAIAAARGARTATGNAGYAVSGLGGESYSISAPQSVTLTRSGGTEEVQLKLKPSQTGGALPGRPGVPSTTRFGLGATVQAPSNATAGVYTGEYGVTVGYQ
jgi:hypothetical protein